MQVDIGGIVVGVVDSESKHGVLDCGGRDDGGDDNDRSGEDLVVVLSFGRSPFMNTYSSPSLSFSSALLFSRALLLNCS